MEKRTRRFPALVLAVLLPMTALTALSAMMGSKSAMAGAVFVILTDGVAAMVVLVAAGGYGYAIFRLFKVGRTGRLLVLATSTALGLWLLSTAVLVVGSSLDGALTARLWWPIIAAGVILALVQARRRCSAKHEAIGKVKPGGFSGVSPLWLLPAAAVGVWLAGAVLPPGWLGNLTMDSYDVLEYHLQLPREYYNAGAVSTLRHNIYSHYPLGVEMLFLLGMCIKGGAYEGMYLAKLIGGMFFVVMIAGVWAGLREGNVSDDQDRCKAPKNPFGARAAVVLLATAPWVLYLSWLGMVEAAEFCYLAMALVWLRKWLARPTWTTAGLIGAMIGAACSVKYLSVGFVAGPILVAMLTCGILRRRRRQVAQAALAAVAAVALFSPWLVRNVVATGNPVFPLATGIFGQGHLTDESARRWRDGHSAAYRQPVPPPPGYKPPARLPGRLRKLGQFALGTGPYRTSPAVGVGMLLLAGGALIWMLAGPGKASAWEWALVAVTVMQLAVWMFFTRNMPGRFISVFIVPLAMFSAGALGRLGRRGRIPAALATVLLVLAAASNLLSIRGYYRAEMDRWRQNDGPPVVPAGVPGSILARDLPAYAMANALDADDRLMLVGEARAFYFPAGSVYATVFDRHPLETAVETGKSSGQIAADLRRMGITRLYVAWMEIDRLANSYGWPADIGTESLRRMLADWPVVDRLYFLDPSGEGADRRVFTLYAVPNP